MYEKIINIEFLQEYKTIQEEDFILSSNTKLIQNIPIIPLAPMTDFELVKTFIGKGGGIGLGHAMIEDSKRNLSIANKQMQIAKANYIKAKNLSATVDTIIEYNENISTLLAKLNLLFMKSISFTDEIINKNGLNRDNYSLDEKKALMSCINLADTIKKIIDTPLINNENYLSKEIFLAVTKGNDCLKKK